MRQTLDNPIKILKAWANVIVKDENVEQEAKRRAKICSGCEFAEHGKLLIFVKDDLKEIQGLYCSDCAIPPLIVGCPLTAKIRGKVICRKWKQDTKQ